MIQPLLSVASKIFDGVQIAPDPRFGIVAAYEFLSHRLDECGHRDLLSLQPTLSLRARNALPPRTPQASAAPAASLCAGHAQQLGSESPLANLMEVRPSNDARATAARRGLKEAWNKRASR